jgi:hypothetical protein
MAVINPTVDLNPYSNQLAQLERRKRMAALLQQQGIEPLESQMVGGRVIPISPWQVLAKALQTGIGAYQERQANQAAEDLQNKMAYDQRSQEAEESAAAKAIQGRMFGQRPDEYTKEGKPVIPGQQDTQKYDNRFYDELGAVEGSNLKVSPNATFAPRSIEEAAQRTQARANEPLEEITPTGQYKYDLPGALQMAMTPAGSAALQKNNLMASMLANMAKPKEPEEFYAPTETSEGLVQFGHRGGTKTSDYKPNATTAKVDFQRKTREYTDAQGNKWSQDYNFNSATGEETNVGSPYKTNIASTSASAKESAEGLRKEYTNQTSQYRSVADAWQKIQKAASAPSAANDISMIYGYMRINDPTSTVREGEFATAQNAAGVPTQVLNMYNRVLNGERLSEEQRQDFVKSAYNLVESQMPNAQALSDRYSAIAKRSSLNPEDVVYDPFASSRVPRIQGENDPNYGKLKSGDLFFGPDGVMRRKK